LNARITGKVEGGVFLSDRKDALSSTLSLFEGKNITITIQRKVRSRSLPQLRYYWSVVVPIVQDALLSNGYPFGVDETHEFVKANFLTEPVVNEDGEVLTDKQGNVINTVRSLADLGGVTTTDFMNLVEKIGQWLSENFDVYLPEPNEQLSLLSQK